MSDALSEDATARQQALTVSTSFIVQAPAGSGKTELLTQRYLALLGQAVTAPEEIIAITFTRKACHEMQHRILMALTSATDQPNPPLEPHRATTWQLARNVLHQDEIHQWQLRQNPHRLRIMTIDALATQLSRQAPIAAQLPASPTICDQAQIDYEASVDAIITNTLQRQSEITPAMTTLLQHLNNDLTLLRRLLCQSLARRDQWLPPLMACRTHPNPRKVLEANLAQVQQDTIADVMAHLGTDDAVHLCQLATQAAKILVAQQPLPDTHPLSVLLTPAATLNDLRTWRALATCLLTQRGTWRKSLTKTLGFSPKSAHKTAMLAYLDQFREQTTLRTALQRCLTCPPARYDDLQWGMVSALMTVLPQLVAQLMVHFQQHGKVDFVELNLAALRALGQATQPTELALILDYQLKHLLVDEFQDTSTTQFLLIEQLMAGWQPHTGRSYFLVGDPMQSIYRFRHADVSLFYRVIRQGIGDLKATYLTLTQNFRSCRGLIHWFNTYFSEIFPPTDDVSIGAIPYTPASTTDNTIVPGVHLIPTLAGDARQQAMGVVQRVQSLLKHSANTRIAILVQSRSQLPAILTALQTAKIPYLAVDIAPLIQQPIVQDLLTLTQVLLDPSDRIAGLALLRTPWCGLSLNDCYWLTTPSEGQPLWTRLIAMAEAKDSKLSPEGQQRCQALVQTLQPIFAARGRQSMAQWIEAAWLALQGPTCLTQPEQIAPVDTYFKVLYQLNATQAQLSLNDLTTVLSQQTLDPATEIDSVHHPRLEIMTVHKAKGLEFDHVILPNLGYSPPYDPHPLLLWQTRHNQQQQQDLILAPIQSIVRGQDPIYQYLRSTEHAKQQQERIRLFYVAATRAKCGLHLMLPIINPTSPPGTDHVIDTPPTGSVLALLWPHLNTTELLTTWQSHRIVPTTDQSFPSTPSLSLKRLPLSAMKQTVMATMDDITDTNPSINTLQTSTPSWQQLLGILIHHGLFLLSHYPDTQQKQAPILSPTYWAQRLKQDRMTTPCPQDGFSDDLPHQIVHALTQTLNDPKGRWILSQQHHDRHSEWHLATSSEQVIIDRSFVEVHPKTQDEVRWIIDYKTRHPYHDLTAYRDQLNHYAKIVAAFDPRPIRLGLYFPRHAIWFTTLPQSQSWEHTDATRHLT